MKKTNNITFIKLLFFTMFAALILVACSPTIHQAPGDGGEEVAKAGIGFLDGFFGKLKGNLKGNNYEITEYDNFGNKTLTVKGKKVSLEGIEGRNEELSSYVNITVDGQDWQHVGGTLVFAQEGVNMITDFQFEEEIVTDGSGSTGFIPADKFINNYRNKLGREAVLVVYSQTGAPIGLFQGNDVYYEIPDNLPKTTMISIDGKLVYVYRANINIFPAKMLDN